MATRIGAFAYLECSARTKEGVQQVVVVVVVDDDDDPIIYHTSIMVTFANTRCLRRQTGRR